MQNNRLKLVEITQDGSPTIRMNGSSLDPLYTEQMHYSTGAASETIYIYGEAVRQAQALISAAKSRYLVVGLGLGYIEILISLMTRGEFKHILSFEKDEDLVRDFSDWRDLKEFKLYDQVTQSLLDQLQISLPLDVVKASLKNKLTLNAALESPLNAGSEKFNVICYDAFSSKMDTQLWEADFLDQFFREYSADQCVFASYSRTGALNRALKKNGFKLIERKGFSTKRECTLAIKA